jgi:hypothetical protein
MIIRKLSKASYNDQKGIKVKGFGSEHDQRGRLVMRKRSKAKKLESESDQIGRLVMKK